MNEIYYQSPFLCRITSSILIKIRILFWTGESIRPKHSRRPLRSLRWKLFLLRASCICIPIIFGLKLITLFFYFFVLMWLSNLQSRFSPFFWLLLQIYIIHILSWNISQTIVFIMNITSHKPQPPHTGMNRDCPELRSLLSALAGRIDATSGKLDSQEIGNAL